jgi:hypothetical protein
MAAQIDGRASPTDAGPLGISSAVVSFAMSSTGTSMVSASAFLEPASTMVTGTVGERPSMAGELVADFRGGVSRRLTTLGLTTDDS